MISNLHIALIQTQLFWEDETRNMKMLEDKIQQIQDNADIILLPETFTTGFSMRKSVAHDPTATVDWMRNLATKKNAAIGGSIFALESNQAYNRFYWVTPQGEVSYYNKRHLFSLTKENEIFNQGLTHCTVDYKGWKISLMVCFDLRFPVWMRRTKEHDYDLMLIVANWPDRRSYAWNQLLIARAIENQSYIAAVNRVGADGNGVLHAGDSVVVDPMGKVMVKARSFQENIITKEISYEWLKGVRTSLPFYQDGDSFSLG